MKALRGLRWLGVAAGAVILVWCLSGITMMSVSHPYVTETEWWRGLPPIGERCCVIPGESLPSETPLAAWSIRMLDTTPVLSVVPDASAHGVLDAPAVFDLTCGARRERSWNWFGAAPDWMHPEELLGASGPAERRALAGEPLDWRRWNADLGGTVARVRAQLPGVVELRSAPLGGLAYIVAATADGQRRRFDSRGEPAPLERLELERALDELGPRIGPPQLLAEGDDVVPRPAWHAVLLNADAVHVYVDPVSGALLQAVDSPRRGFRWWQSWRAPRR